MNDRDDDTFLSEILLIQFCCNQSTALFVHTCQESKVKSFFFILPCFTWDLDLFIF